MSQTVPFAIGSGLTAFKNSNPGKRNVGDGVVVLNPEDSSACISVSGSSVVVTTGAAVALPATPLIYRRALQIQNVGGGPIAFAGSGVGLANGMLLYPGQTQSFMATPHITIWGIASGVDTIARILELA